jgi:glutamyl-tRNA synthetase
MLVPPGKTEVRDLLREPLEFENASQDDQVLIKSDGFPTYHLASTVDDHLMQISHVIRGDEWLASSPKQVMLYQMLGWDPPEFAHLPLVLGPDKAKLSKRHGAVSVLDYREEGYLPEAMVNFLAFLGWSPGTGEEFFTLEQLCAVFDLDKVQVSPAVFDRDKLNSVNGHHIRALSAADVAGRLRPFVHGISDGLLEKAAPLVQERIQTLNEADGLLHFLAEAPTRMPLELVPKGRDAAGAITVLAQVRALFAAKEVGPEADPELRDLAQRAGWKAGEMFMTLRIALTGSRITPPLLESATLLGREECLRRIDFAIQQLQSGKG